MTLHLVRHAAAGDRSRFAGGDDLERPLDERGHEQAAALVPFFAERPVRAVWSSLATRCSQTVGPLAAAHGLEVELRRELTEGARPNDLLELMREQALIEGDIVMCLSLIHI